MMTDGTDGAGPSIQRRLKWSMMAFGLAMGLIFPVYASFFVEWKPGMFPFFAVGAVAAGVCVGVVNNLLIRVILLPKLRRISTLAKALKQGDVTQRCEIESHDEIGQIASDLDSSVAQLGVLLWQVRGSVDELAAMTVSADEVCHSLNERSQLMFANTSAAAEATDEMSLNLALISGSIEAMSHQSMTASDMAAVINQNTMNTNAVVRASQDRISAISTRTDEISSGARTIAVNSRGALEVTLEAVGGVARSQEITLGVREAVTDVLEASGAIGELSDHAKMVSLNAAVEAASAGEAGAGFAVVATEVKRFAESTKSLATEIGRDVNDLNAATDGSVREIGRVSEVLAQMRTFIESVADDSKSQNEASHLNAQNLASAHSEINRVAEMVTVITSKIAGIAGALSKLAAGAEEISAATSEAAVGADEVAGKVSSIRTGVEANSQSAAELEAALSRITETQRHLGQLTARFELGPPPPGREVVARPPLANGPELPGGPLRSQPRRRTVPTVAAGW